MVKRLITLAVVVSLGAASSAAADPLLLFSGFAGQFYDQNVGTVSPDGNTVSWGTNVGNGLSSYSFDLPGDFGTTGGIVDIGTFMHQNQTIGGPFLETVSYGLDFMVGGVAAPTITLHLTHEETGNKLTPCPYGAPGDPINQYGCADKVGFSIEPSDPFPDIIVDDALFTVTLLGLAVGASEPAMNGMFLTPERSTNGVSPLLQVLVESTPISSEEQPVTPVPEPATLWLVGTGLFAVAAVRRHQQKRH